MSVLLGPYELNRQHPVDALTGVRNMPDESVQCIVTSPPYWGLRVYDGAPDLVWGGDADCEHVYSGQCGPKTSQPNRKRSLKSTEISEYKEVSQGRFCQLCSAWRGCLGLEPTPELYIEHMVLIFREYRRVLRKDGTLWLNLGDSYANNTCGGGSPVDNRKPEYGRKGYAGDKVRGREATKNYRIPLGLKPKDLVGIPWRVALALQADGWWLRSDIIWHKCLSGGAVLWAKTQKGVMPSTLKDLVRLNPDTVQLWDGKKWNQVVEWGTVGGDVDRKKKGQKRRAARYRGKESAVDSDIEIEFLNGERIGCTREHKWPTQRDMITASNLCVGDVVPSYIIPPPECPDAPQHLNGYDIGWFIGLYIAEGSVSDGTIQIASHIKEYGRYSRLKQIAADYHGTCAVHKTSDNGVTMNINSRVLLGIVETYVSGKTAKTKHLHPRCWTRGNAFLHSLLCGYLDGDGHKRQNGSWRVGFTNNDALAQDLRTLAARLGYSLRLRRGTATNTTTGKKHKCWRGDVELRPERRRRPDGTVIAIRQSRARKFHNITLAEEPHIFCLASGISTGNSNPMPESVTDRPTKSHEYIFLMTKSARYFYDADAVREEFADDRMGNPGSKGLRKYAPGDRQDVGRPMAWDKGVEQGGRNRRSVWTFPTQPNPAAHFATFPDELPRICIMAGTKPSDIVCDPFGGIGTTGKMAIELGRQYIGLEISERYCKMFDKIVLPAAREKVKISKYINTQIKKAAQRASMPPKEFRKLFINELGIPIEDLI